MRNQDFDEKFAPRAPVHVEIFKAAAREIMQWRDACLLGMVMLCAVMQLRMWLEPRVPPATVAAASRDATPLPTGAPSRRPLAPNALAAEPPNEQAPREQTAVAPPPVSRKLSPMLAPTTHHPASAPAAHVAVGADRLHWPGVIGVVNSLRRNSATPERLRIHVLVPAGAEGPFTAFLRCHGIAPGSSLDVLGFAPEKVPHVKVRVKLTNLESPLNFARFYLHELLPTVDKVLYLDADVVVLGDVPALLDAIVPSHELCAATSRKARLGDKGIASLKSPALQNRFEARYAKRIPLRSRGFNAGVFVFNLVLWRELNLTSEVEHWMRANNEENLYALGSQVSVRPNAAHAAAGAA